MLRNSHPRSPEKRNTQASTSTSSSATTPLYHSPVRSPSKGNPYKTPERNPVPAMTAPLTPLEEERFLYAVLALAIHDKKERDDLWHVMTVAPTNYLTRMQYFQSILKRDLGPLMKGGTIEKIYTKLIDPKGVLCSIMFSDCSVYGKMTHRPHPERLLHHARHEAQTTLHEKKTGAPTGGHWHDEKCMTISNSINNVFKLFDRIEKYIEAKTLALDEVLDLIKQFRDYLNLHVKIFEVAIAYVHDPNKKLNKRIYATHVSDQVLEWHPHPLKITTPQVVTPGIMRVREEYEQTTGRNTKAPRVIAGPTSAGANITTPPKSSGLTPQFAALRTTASTLTYLPSGLPVAVNSSAARRLI